LRALLKAWSGNLEEIVEEVVVRAVAVGEKGRTRDLVIRTDERRGGIWKRANHI